MMLQHLLMDGHVASADVDVDRLGDMPRICSLLDQLPVEIGMTKIGPPYVFHTHTMADGRDWWGVTGFVLIAESHIALHTFPQQCCFLLDVFSCRPFDVAAVVRRVEAWFRPVTCSWRTISRASRAAVPHAPVASELFAVL